jgi:hypothetical protein
MQTIYSVIKYNNSYIITSNKVFGNAFAIEFSTENEANIFCKENNLITESLKTKIKGFTVVGFTNLNLLGKKATLKIYKTKARCKIAAAKIVAKNKIKAAKQFVDDFANVLKGEALKAKAWTAKRILRLKGWSWQLYINVCNAYRLLNIFNKSVDYSLRVKI